MSAFCETKDGVTIFKRPIQTEDKDKDNCYVKIKPRMGKKMFNKPLKNLCSQFGIEETEIRKLFEFSSDSEIGNAEIVISFWLFFKDEEARINLINFLQSVLDPRIYASGVTRAQCVETVLVVNVANLNTTPTGFQNWFENFLLLLKVSADCLTLPGYMSAQMTTCFDRILNANNVVSNVRENKDFCRLYQENLHHRMDESQVFLATGMNYSPSNFIALQTQVNMMSLQQEKQFIEKKKQRRANFELGHIVLALFKTKCINSDTKTEMLRLLQIEETSVSVANARNSTNLSNVQNVRRTQEYVQLLRMVDNFSQH